MERTSKKIGLLHHLGAGNLGDDASMDAVLRNINNRCSDTEFCAFSMNPADTHQARHPSIPITEAILGSAAESSEIEQSG